MDSFVASEDRRQRFQNDMATLAARTGHGYGGARAVSDIVYEVPAFDGTQ